MYINFPLCFTCSATFPIPDIHSAAKVYHSYTVRISQSPSASSARTPWESKRSGPFAEKVRLLSLARSFFPKGGTRMHAVAGKGGLGKNTYYFPC